MKNWLKISLLLCSFGFFREFRPNEPFMADFLSGEWRNITDDQVNRDIYPLGTYSYMAQLIVIFLITDFVRYKPILIVSALLGIVMWCLMLWTTELIWLQVVQLFYGTYMAAEVAYYTYCYAKVEKENYQKVTSHTRAAIFGGKFFSALIGQLLVSYKVMDLRQLNFITLGTQIASAGLVVLLPRVRKSLYFHNNNETDEQHVPSKQQNTINRAMYLIKDHFITAYSNKDVLYWSIWWTLGTGGAIQAQTYAQLLWIKIDPKREKYFNGGVEAGYTLFATVTALIAGFVDMEFFERHHMWIITVCSISQGVITIFHGLTTNILVAYGMYILFGTIYSFMITLVSASVAKRLADDSFALIFGINTFLALVFQSLLTLIVVSDTGLALSPKYQYVVNGSYFLVLAFLYAVLSIGSKVVSKFKQ